jgi:hypothetical protein
MRADGPIYDLWVDPNFDQTKKGSSVEEPSSS